MRIGIIGHFGGYKNFTDGQTVKTLSLYEALMDSKINDCKIDKIDTFFVKNNILLFSWHFFKCILFDKKIIALLSINGRKFLFPILYIASKYLGKEVYYYAIGGRLSCEIDKYPKWKKYISSFSSNWMESEILVNSLKKKGINNAIFIPNFKRLSPLDLKDDNKYFTKNIYKFCTFSRVMEEKGITDAIKAIKEVHELYMDYDISLDIYGPIDENYRPDFEKEIKSSNSVCKYCGIVSPNKSVDVLKKYYMLLFPTHWKHEGIPGTIIDALMSGLPIIARKWEYCDEMIKDGVTGYTYDFDNPSKLKETIIKSIQNEDCVKKMKKNCLKYANNYSQEKVLKIICKEMNLK